MGHVSTTPDATLTVQARVWIDGFELGGARVYLVDQRGDWHGSFRIPERGGPRPPNAIGDSITAQCDYKDPHGVRVILILYHSHNLTVLPGQGLGIVRA